MAYRHLLGKPVFLYIVYNPAVRAVCKFQSLSSPLRNGTSKSLSFSESFICRMAAPRWFLAVGNVSLQLLRPSKYLLRKKTG